MNPTNNDQINENNPVQFITGNRNKRRGNIVQVQDQSNIEGLYAKDLFLLFKNVRNLEQQNTQEIMEEDSETEIDENIEFLDRLTNDNKIIINLETIRGLDENIEDPIELIDKETIQNTPYEFSLNPQESKLITLTLKNKKRELNRQVRLTISNSEHELINRIITIVSHKFPSTHSKNATYKGRVNMHYEGNFTNKYNLSFQFLKAYNKIRCATNTTHANNRKRQTSVFTPQNTHISRQIPQRTPVVVSSSILSPRIQTITANTSIPLNALSQQEISYSAPNVNSDPRYPQNLQEMSKQVTYRFHTGEVVTSNVPSREFLRSLLSNPLSRNLPTGNISQPRMPSQRSFGNTPIRSTPERTENQTTLVMNESPSVENITFAPTVSNLTAVSNESFETPNNFSFSNFNINTALLLKTKPDSTAYWYIKPN